MLRLLSLFRRQNPGFREVPEAGESPLWLLLCQRMADDALWKRPQLCLDVLSRELRTNRTTLARLYRCHGTSFSADLRARRISFILDQLEQDPQMLLEPLFYEAGYRNYSTGWRQFRRETGVSPSSYVQQLQIRP